MRELQGKESQTPLAWPLLRGWSLAAKHPPLSTKEAGDAPRNYERPMRGVWVGCTMG